MPLDYYFCEAWQRLQENVLMDLMRLAVVGLNSAACKHCVSFGFDVFARMLFITAAGC